MGQMVQALLKLQEVEQELIRLRNERSHKERAVKIAEKRLAELGQQAKGKSSEVQRQQLKAQRLEGDVRQREEHIAKLRQQLNTTRTSREYAAILTQMNTDKADSTKIEDAALQALQDVDELKAEVEKFTQQDPVLSARVEQTKAELQRFVAENEDVLRQLDYRKRNLAEEIPHHTLVLFERVAEYHDGEAMAVVTRTHPKRDEFVCGGCHMNVTMEQVNALMTKDEVEACNNCGRILFLEAGT